MRIIKPLVIVEDDLGMLMPNGYTQAQHMAKKIEFFARKCYKSEGKMTGDSHEKFLPGVFNTKRHTGIAEHRIISITFITDRGVSHEGLRHRMAAPYEFGADPIETIESGGEAFLQESTRYCDYSGICKKCGGVGIGGELGFAPCPECPKNKGVTYILPPWVDMQVSFADNAVAFLGAQRFIQELKLDDERYARWRKWGWKPEQARYWLPQGVKTEYAASLNLGSWWNFCVKRSPEAAHPQMRQLAIPVLRYLQQHLPQFFGSVPFPAGAWHPSEEDAPEVKLFSHKGERYEEAKLVVNPFYDSVNFEEVYAA